MYTNEERVFNWSRKGFLAQAAKEHMAAMEQNYGAEINASRMQTRQYSGVPEKRKREVKKPNVCVQDCDSIAAVECYAAGYKSPAEPYGKTAVLNFASYKKPGGMFLNGSQAQEEALCHGSNLYNVLKNFSDYYAWNQAHLNRALYQNRALYTPDILFFKDGGIYRCDVITCAAPNASAAVKCGVHKEEISTVLSNRILFILGIAEEEQVDTLILGAWGCGVFGLDPDEVASQFRECLGSGQYGFTNVVFAVPQSDNNQNLQAFCRVFA